MKKNETMRGLCLLLAMVMVLSLMPMSVLAVDATDSDVPEQPTGTVVYINGQDVTTIDEGDDTISWDEETKTLTLNNANILADNGTHKGAGIYVVGSDTVVLELKGENTVEGKFNGRTEDTNKPVDDIFASAAVSVDSDLIIRGEGSLTATDLEIDDAPSRSAGIFVGGDFTMESGTVYATANSAANGSKGILCGDHDENSLLTVTGGTVHASGRTTGIQTYGTVHISGGTVTATATDDNDGWGINTHDLDLNGLAQVNISGGTVTAQGSNGAIFAMTTCNGYYGYMWKNAPDAAPNYGSISVLECTYSNYIRIEPADYRLVHPMKQNNFTVELETLTDGEYTTTRPEGITAEYQWYQMNAHPLTDKDVSVHNSCTYEASTGLWTIPSLSEGVLGLAAEPGDVITVDVKNREDGLLFIASWASETFFTESDDGVFTLAVTEADIDPETGLVAVIILSEYELQCEIFLSTPQEVQTASEQPNRLISDTAGTYFARGTIKKDGVTFAILDTRNFDYTYTGWKSVYDQENNLLGTQYILDHVAQYTGWTEIEGDWYYLDPVTGYRAEGVSRVPYPAETINGLTYEPDQESIDYAASKGQTFIDKDTALFWFDTDGRFLSSYTGIVPSEDGPSQYAVNGMIPWHVGLVQVGEDYYYFIGNSEIGGNKMHTGDIYANRNTTDFDMVVGGVYTFGADGKLCMYDGIVDVNGVLRYYQNAQLMLGKGLTKVGDNYIYVNSKGELIVDAEYYVPGNDLGIASGTYYFDENGYLVNPVSTDKDGVYFENGAWYYYENGKIAYNKGLIAYGDGYIYVRSSGKLATGTYYITNVSNDTSGLFTMGMKVQFSENGIADAPKNGIYEIDGQLYYFVGNQIQYNAGLIEYNGGWIYVRSSGKLATGAYWITNTNGNLDAGMYEFGEDGYLVISDVEDGIVDENGVLYYYLDGKKQYGIGLRQLEDGSYIYVRTNGELAVGSYWITNHNGLLPEGMYEFDADGILIEN